MREGRTVLFGLSVCLSRSDFPLGLAFFFAAFAFFFAACAFCFAACAFCCLPSANAAVYCCVTRSQKLLVSSGSL